MDGGLVWQTAEGPGHPPLRGRQQAEAVVVGGGLCGVTTSLLLARGGLQVALLEADRLGGGASTQSLGMATVQHGLIYTRLNAQWGQEVAQAYALSQSAARNSMASLAQELHIPCAFQTQDSSLAAMNGQEERLLEKEERASQKAGLPAAMRAGGESPFPVRCLLTVPGQAMLDPAAYLQGLLEAFTALGGRVYEHSRAVAADAKGVATETGSVRAPFVIHATHFPILHFPKKYLLLLRQRRSCAAALRNAPDFQGMYLHAAQGSFCIRRYGGQTLLRCFDYLCGRETHVDHGRLLKSAASLLFPEAEIGALWHGQDVFSADGLPFIGPCSPATPNHFIAAGFGGFGMTGSMAAAQAISARILGVPLAELSIYDPSRTARCSVFPILQAAGEQTAARLTGLIRRRAPRCPHMGCKLRYVPSTASWDCPCHGSRFDSIGRVANGPAVRPARIRNKNRP